MGCGSSSQVVPELAMSNGHAKTVDDKGVVIRDYEDDDDLPTVLLTDTPVRPKTPIAFEIPIEELDITRKDPLSTPPPQIQRLLQPPQADITLPDIEEKLAIAEARRQTLLLQRAASAQKRTQKMLKAINGMQRVESEQDSVTDIENQANDTFGMDSQHKPNSRPPTVDLGKRSTFPPNILPRASINEDLSYNDSKRTSIDGKRPSMDGKMPAMDSKMPAMDDRMPAMDSKMPSMDDRIPAMESKMPAMDGKMTIMDGKRSSMDGKISSGGKRPFIDTKRPSIDANKPQMEVKRTINDLGGGEQKRQSNERKDLKTPQTIERKNSTDLRRMR